LSSPESAKVKAALRKEVLAKRDAMGGELRRNLSATILQSITSLPSYREASAVLAYSSFGSELQTQGFLYSVLEEGKTLVLPRVNRTKKCLDLYEIEDPARDLESGVWGIFEPRVDLTPVEPDAIDFVLVPGAAFDGRGARLGYGGGFYDKLLGGSGKERLRPVAGAFELQMVREIPVNQHDVLMELVVTESSSYPSSEGSTGL
jgi:5-formyltetrahydrofolate cyclo-ligase